MDDEIKEILNRLDYNEWEVDLYKVPITWCELYDIRDYITNLQQENERLKENNKAMQEEMAKTWKIADDYKSRIDKAIEYINNFDIDKKFSFPLMKRWEENQVKSSIEYEFKDTLYKDLLNILNGGE